MMELPLPSASKKVSLEQRLGEADGYYRLLRGQVQVYTTYCDAMYGDLKVVRNKQMFHLTVFV